MENADFFVSYTSQDLAWARWIAAQVEAGGFTVILQDWDWRPGANFVAEMHRALQRSSRLILVASQAYLASRWAEEEWTAAYYRGRDRIIPVCIESLTLPGLLGPLARIDLFGLTESDAQDRLVRGLSLQMPHPTKAAFPGLTDPPFPSDRWSKTVAPARNLEFRGRVTELEALVESLRSQSVVVIAGLAGIGKTELAAEFFYRQAPHTSFSWWVACHDQEVFLRDLASAAISLGLADANEPLEKLAIETLRIWLSSHSDWLLVLDDVRDADVPHSLLGLTGGQIIVTTANVGWAGVGKVIELGTWARSDSIEFLETRIGGGNELDELSERLGDLPLALTQARSYIAGTGATVARYLDLFKQRHSELLDRGDPGTHGSTLKAAIDMTVLRLSQDARNLALICSAYASAPIPIEIFRSVSDMEDLLPGPLSDELALEDSIRELRRFSLIQRDGPSVSLHQLIQHLLLDGLEPDERKLVVARAAALLATATPVWTDRPENWDQCERLLPHVFALLEHPEFIEMPDASAWLLNRMGVYLGARGEDAQGLQMLERARLLAEESGDRGLLGSVLSNLGNAIASLGDLDRGIELMERALVEKRAAGSSAMLMARSIGALGSLTRRKGDFATAMELHREALRLLEEDPEADEHTRASECNDIGVCATELGLLDEAMAMHSRAMDTFRRIQGARGLDVARTHAAMGLLLYEMGDFASAMAHQEEALQILQAHLERDHPDVSPLLSQLGLTLIALDRNEEARETLERAVTVGEERLGREHYEVGFRLGNLGIALMNLGALDDSIRAHSRSLSLLRRGLGDGHRSVAIQRALLAEVLLLTGRVKQAEGLLKEATNALTSFPPSQRLRQIVDRYIEVLVDRGRIDLARTLVSDLIGYLDQVTQPERTTWFAWLAGVCVELGDQEKLAFCLSQQQPI